MAGLHNKMALQYISKLRSNEEKMTSAIHIELERCKIGLVVQQTQFRFDHKKKRTQSYQR